MKTFDERFEESLLQKQDDIAVENSNTTLSKHMVAWSCFGGGANWTKPALKAAYHAMKATRHVLIREYEKDFFEFMFVELEEAVEEIEKLLGGEK